MGATWEDVRVQDAGRLWSTEGLDVGAISAFVLFIGPSRSGTSVVGAFLDAHPQCCVAHEMAHVVPDCLRHGRTALLRLVGRSQSLARGGGRYSGRAEGGRYCQSIPGQAKTDLARVRVVGNKNAPNDLTDLGRDPQGHVSEMEDRMQMPVYLISMVRNPYDMYVANVLAGERDIFCAVHRLAPGWVRVLDAVRSRVLVVRLEAMCARPRETIAGIMAHCGLKAHADVVERCVRHLRSPRQRRRDYGWTPEERAAISRLVDTCWLFRGYGL